MEMFASIFPIEVASRNMKVISYFFFFFYESTLNKITLKGLLELKQCHLSSQYFNINEMTSACLYTLRENDARPIRACIGCRLFYNNN